MANEYNKPLLLIVGESGTGKTSIVNELEKRGLETLKSYTTRARRHREDKDHIFITKPQFKNLKNIVAVTYFNKNYYGATQEQVDKSNTYVIDLAGIDYFRTHYNSAREIKVVLIKISFFRKLFRLLKRDGIKKAIERIKHDKKAFKDVEQYADKIIINNNLKYSCDEILDYYTKLSNEHMVKWLKDMVQKGNDEDK